MLFLMFATKSGAAVLYGGARGSVIEELIRKTYFDP